MLKEWIQENLIKPNGCVNRVVQRKLSKNNPEIYTQIEYSYGETFDEKIYCILNDITSVDECSICRKEKEDV